MDALILHSLQGALALFIMMIIAATWRLSSAYREMSREERRVARMIEKRAERARLKAARRKVQPSRMRGTAAGTSAARKVQAGGQGVSKRA